MQFCFPDEANCVLKTAVTRTESSLRRDVQGTGRNAAAETDETSPRHAQQQVNY